MKKLFGSALLVALIASTASAASFSWSTGNAIQFDGTTLKSSTDVTAYLIYLGNGASLSDVTLTADSTAESVASSIGTVAETYTAGTTRAGKIASKLAFSYADGDYRNNDTFALLLSYTSGSDTYLNLSSSTYTITGLTDDTATIADASFSVSGTKVGESSTLSAGSGWVQAVPEPSTAALALAGLALLLKRRKA